jgi:hypothetical protein
MSNVVPGRGCPICGFDYSTWSLNGQRAHLWVDHRWRQRLALRRRVGVPLTELLIQRKYRVRPGYTDTEEAS